VHELSVRLAVVEETKLTQVGDGLGGEVEPGDQVVVVVVRDGEELQPGSRDSRARSPMRSVLKAMCWGSPEVSKTGGATFSGTRMDRSAVRITWLRTSPVGPATSTATEASSPSTLV
jgi:hypothetical protein